MLYSFNKFVNVLDIHDKFSKNVAFLYL